jgi:hypothetical protein
MEEFHETHALTHPTPRSLVVFHDIIIHTKDADARIAVDHSKDILSMRRTLHHVEVAMRFA